MLRMLLLVIHPYSFRWASTRDRVRACSVLRSAGFDRQGQPLAAQIHKLAEQLPCLSDGCRVHVAPRQLGYACRQVGITALVSERSARVFGQRSTGCALSA